MRVKGKLEPVAIYEPLGQGGAEQGLRDLLARAPQTRPYELYLERIAHFRADPPGAEWDGVFVFTTK